MVHRAHGSHVASLRLFGAQEIDLSQAIMLMLIAYSENALISLFKFLATIPCSSGWRRLVGAIYVCNISQKVKGRLCSRR